MTITGRPKGRPALFNPQGRGMTLTPLQRIAECRWLLPPTGCMRVPGMIFASEALVSALEPEVLRQVHNVACLPGIVSASLAMPDAHSGYGFPIGGVAAFDPDQDGVVSAGGVGFDIACGVRTLLTGLHRDDILATQEALADALFFAVPSGVGSTGSLRLSDTELDAMLSGGAKWAVQQGFGAKRDLNRTEEHGRVEFADPAQVSPQAKARMRDQVGTLGSGNHYLEVQWVAEVLDPQKAGIFGLNLGDAVVSIHCGSRGLGHQIGNDYMPRMLAEAQKHGLKLPDRELACAPIRSELGRQYLGAMAAGINCALANRQHITHLVRQAFARIFATADMPLLYDVCHNTCRQEEHLVHGMKKRLFVHRKGATRSFCPGHPSLPSDLAKAGQPVLVGGSMGASSYILAGSATAMELSFGSTCHGAGRAMSRSRAKKAFRGRDVVESLRRKGVFVRSSDFRGVAEEAPGAYKDVDAVVASAASAGLAVPVARLEPLVCVKG